MNIKLILLVMLAFLGLGTANAQIGIGTTSPDASAQLELQSSEKGFLPPRMDTDARDGIGSPAQGLMIYCTNCGTNGEAQVYNGTEWTNMTGGSASAGLYVPDAPTIDGVTSDDGQVDVAFTAPSDNGGSAITSYTATSDPGDYTGTLSQAGDGTITVSGLTNGTEYKFTVTATNAVGTSAASAASSSVTPAKVPDAPTIDGVTSGDGQVDVAFTAPSDNGGSAITSYTATSDPDNQTGTLSQAGDGTITVSGLTNGTEYTFTVTATNSVGTSAASAASNEITPVGLPEAPTIDGVTSGDGQVDIAFTAPADDGGSTITEYTATSNPDNKTETLSQAGSGTITVSGLTNGTEYTFTVTATNAVGTSAASVASSLVTPAKVPDAPTIDGVTSGDGQAEIAFTAPADDGGSTITQYTATSDPGNKTGTLSQAGDGTITVSGLTNGTEYKFTVTATNAVGTSTPSEFSPSVTPSPPPPPTVIGPSGKVWMDRNLGATQVANDKDDTNAYGDLYQWGRAADGHEKRSSPEHNGTSVRPTTITDSGAWNGKFIINKDDWVTTKNDEAWNTGTEDNPIKTATDPCPSGFRLPTNAEWVAESNGWNNASDAFNSKLKLPVSGFRNKDGELYSSDDSGFYWSSTASSGDSVWYLKFSPDVSTGSGSRSYGFAIRCIKE